MNILIIAFNDSGRYTALAAAKSVAGLGGLESNIEHNRAQCGFFVLNALAYLNYGGLGGEAFGLAGFYVDRSANAIQITTLALGGVSGGELSKLNMETAIMATIPAIAQPEITVINGQAVTSSLAVANYFTKRHDDVLKKIRALECSPEFTARNFAVSEYTDASGRKLPCYHITRDGFAFLAMGFTGKRAAQFKEAYINAFNQMERELTPRPTPDSVAHNAGVVYEYVKEIHHVWANQLHPMLVAVNSPLAYSLHHYINDVVLGASLVNSSLNGKRREVKP